MGIVTGMLDSVGKGGFGAVYKGFNRKVGATLGSRHFALQTGEVVAFKIFHSFANANWHASWKKEVDILKVQIKFYK